MSTESPAATSTIDLNHPALTAIQPDYAAIRDGRVTERYQNAAMPMQNYALRLAYHGKEGWATRLLSCCRSGSETEICDRKKYASAHRHHCGDPFCVYDSSGRYRFNKWAARRDPDMFKLPHTAFELKIPGTCDCTELPWAERQMHTVAMLGGLAWAIMERLQQNYVCVDAFAERLDNTAVRVVVPGTLNYSQVQYWAEKLSRDFVGKHEPTCKTHPQVTIKRGPTIELFHWAFNGFKECAAMNPDLKAQLRIALAEHRSVEAAGECYAPVMEAGEAQPTEACLCPVCKDHNLTHIPPEERHARPIEDIMTEYEHVNWGRENDSPFLIRRKSPTDKLPASPTMTIAITASPPS